ncbi:MAG: ABC transporter ATP-binding protein [bacterium]|nr:ABC transporter ATP-binding protein [bacterium]
MQSFQSTPYELHLLRHSTESMQSVLGHVSQFSTQCLLVLLRLAAEGCVTLAVLGLLAWASPSALALLVGLLGGTGFAYDRLFRRRIREAGTEIANANVQMYRGVQQGLEGLREIRVLGWEPHFLAEVREGASRAAEAAARYQILQVAPRYLVETLLITFVVAIVLFAEMRGEGLIRVAPLLAMFGAATLRLVPSTNLLLGGLSQLRFSRHAVESLSRDLARAESMPAARRSANRARDPEPLETLEFRGVGFRYPEAAHATVSDIDLVLRRGESIGLVGPSGSGKTTLMDIMLGLLVPQQGEVFFNGRPLCEDTRAWLDQVAYLPQTGFLIDDTLRRNIALGVPNAEIDERRLSDSVRQARLADLVRELPKGLATTVGERGTRLSGGQQQRVALARAFYHGRDVLVMDEATSALDPASEREIVEEIGRLKADRTLVIIAHRLTTVRYCDRIYRLDRGRIVSSGPFREEASDVA